MFGAEDDGDAGRSEEGGGFQWPDWFSKDDFVTVAIALCVSYGIRWCAPVPSTAGLMTP